ncbi:MAG: hypothetical protein ACM3MK_11730 [Chitinophagales bacterium]
MLATFALRPSSAKRLIARGISQMPEVVRAMSEGRIIITGGTTNGFVAEELGIEIHEKGAFTAGVVTDGLPCMTDAEKMETFPICLDKGKAVNTPWLEFLAGFNKNDVFIKGANAIDPDGNAGILLGNPLGGTIGASIGMLTALGCHLIVPVGYEKLIPSCKKAAETMGLLLVDKSLGMRMGFMQLSTAQVVTEVEALQTLCGVQATVVGAGGIGGMEGATVLAVQGDESKVEQAMRLARTLMKEKPLKSFRRSCKGCPLPCSFVGK